MARRILVLRAKPLKYFIQSIPAFSAIRKFHKDDEISILTDKSLVRFCKKSGFFDKVWLDSQPEWFDLPGIYDIMTRLRKGRFDIVYDLDNSKRSEWYFRLIGFNKPFWNSSVIDWCTHPYIPKEDEDLHFQETLHNQLEVAGIKRVPDVDISYMATDKEHDDLPKNFVMICAAGDKDKLAHKWDPLGYAELIDHLEENLNLKSVLIGDDNDDYWMNDYIIDKCVTAKPINYSGKTNLRGIINVAMKAKFCVGNETAPTHIAAYSKCKTIMLCSRFSPPELVAPRVRNLAVIEEPMLENVSVERVLYTINDFAMTNEEYKEYEVASEHKDKPKEADFER